MSDLKGKLTAGQTLTGELASAPYIPERMPHKLTFTGAVEGEYDGSRALNIEIPEKMEESDPTVPAWAKEANKPTYTAQEVGAMPANATVVKTVNGVTPDRSGNVNVEGGTGGITQETDPTVPAWAKAKDKPSYTAQEVGALPADTEIPVVPTKVSAFENDRGYLTEHQDLSGYAKSEDIPTKPSDIGAQPAGNYATKDEIPTTLPNPHKLTFSGAVNAEYDGSEAVEVVIPQGGGSSGGGGGDVWEEIVNYTVPESVSGLTIDKDINGNPFELKRWLLLTVWHPVEGVTTQDRVQVGFTPQSRWGQSLYEAQKAPAATEKAGSTLALCCAVAGQQIIEAFEKGQNTTSAAFTLMMANNTTGRDTNLQGDFTQNGLSGNATCITFSGISTGFIHAGSVIKMWGVRA